MKYITAKPSPVFSGMIRQYWAMENCFPAGKQHIQRIVPSGLPEIIFYLSDRPVSRSNTGSITEHTLINGHLKAYYDLEISGELSLFTILFDPHGLSCILDIPIRELYDQSVPLRYLFKQDTARLENRLYEAGSFAERQEIIESFLLKQLALRSKKYHLPRIAQALSLINRSRGKIRIDALASEACFSRKQFERVFSQYVGTSPKQLLKTVRFQHAIELKSRKLSSSLTDLTYRCGYYDQAHMINEFRSLTGMTPTRYFENCEPYSDYFQVQ